MSISAAVERESNNLVGNTQLVKLYRYINRRFSGWYLQFWCIGAWLGCSVLALALLSGCLTYYEVDTIYDEYPLFEARGVTFSPSESAPNPQAIQEVASGARTVANAAWWGFDAFDSTSALQQAFDSGAAVIHIPNMGGRPWNSRPLYLRSNQTIIIERGTTIQARRGAFQGGGDVLFTGNDIENVVIQGYGATMRMWREDYYSPPYSNSEFRFLFSLRGTRNVTIEGLFLTGSGGDGIYLGSLFREGSPYPNIDTHIKNMIISYHPRQAISVINAEGLLIEGSWLINTRGYFPYPQAGIDFEPNNPTERIIDCVIRNSYIIGNAGSGILVSLQHLNGTSPPVSISIENTRIKGNGFFGIHLVRPDPEVRGRIEFLDNHIEGGRLLWDASAPFSIIDN